MESKKTREADLEGRQVQRFLLGLVVVLAVLFVALEWNSSDSGWAFFDSNETDAVVSMFGSGCSTVVSMTVAENARGGHRCFLGLFDPSVRPWVGRDELSFTIPFSRFVTMMDTMKECFLFDSHAWKKVKAGIEEDN